MGRSAAGRQTRQPAQRAPPRICMKAGDTTRRRPSFGLTWDEPACASPAARAHCLAQQPLTSRPSGLASIMTCHSSPGGSTTTVSEGARARGKTQPWMPSSLHDGRAPAAQPLAASRLPSSFTSVRVVPAHRNPTWMTTGSHPKVPGLPSQLSHRGSTFIAYIAGNRQLSHGGEIHRTRPASKPGTTLTRGARLAMSRPPGSPPAWAPASGAARSQANAPAPATMTASAITTVVAALRLLIRRPTAASVSSPGHQKTVIHVAPVTR